MHLTPKNTFRCATRFTPSGPAWRSFFPLRHMRRALPFLTLLPLAFLGCGCVCTLRTASQPTDVKLRLQTAQPQQHIVRVALDSPADYSVGLDGRVQFT